MGFPSGSVVKNPSAKQETWDWSLGHCLFNLYAEYIMRNRLEEAQAGIKIAGRNNKPLSHPKTEAHVFNWHCLLTSSYEWGSDQQAAKLIEYPLPSWPWDKEGSELTGTPDWLIAHDPVIKTASCAESLTQWEKIPMGCHGMTLRILGSVSKTKQ